MRGWRVHFKEEDVSVERFEKFGGLGQHYDHLWGRVEGICIVWHWSKMSRNQGEVTQGGNEKNQRAVADLIVPGGLKKGEEANMHGSRNLHRNQVGKVQVRREVEKGKSGVEEAY